MKVVIYARVSSQQQADNELSISAQLKALRKYAEDREWEVVTEYVDQAESARTANRPAFQEMITCAKAKPRPFEAILVWKLSRFARNREDSIVYKSLLRKRGISLISINEPIDDSPLGRLIEAIIEAIDEFYSINLAQDTRRGMRENAMRGFCNGRREPIGYVKVKVMDGKNERNKLGLDEVYAPLVQRIFRMGLDGMGAKEVAKTLNEEGILTNTGRKWGKNLIFNIWRNERYTGTQLWNETTRVAGIKKKNPEMNVVRFENSHPAIVDYDTFDAMQKICDMRAPMKRFHPREVSSRYLLSGLVRCECGAKMTGHSAKSGKVLYYACLNQTRKGKSVCAAKWVNRDKLENFIVEKVRDHIFTEKNISLLVRLTNDEIKVEQGEEREAVKIIEKQLTDTNRKLDI